MLMPWEGRLLRVATKGERNYTKLLQVAVVLKVEPTIFLMRKSADF